MTKTKELHSVRFNLTYDEIFKGSFSDSSTATKLVNIVLNENIDEKEVSITSSELLGESIEIKSSFFDVRIKVANEYDIDLEMQKYKPYNYYLIDRLVYYLGKMISLSVVEGENYKSKKCITIVFMNFSLEGYDKCLNEVTFKKDDNTIVSNHKIILIDLTKIDKCDKVELSKWLNLMTSNDVLSFKGEDEIMDKVIKKVIDLNANDKLMAQMMSREKYIRDKQAEEYHRDKQLQEIAKGEKRLAEGEKRLAEEMRHIEKMKKTIEEKGKEESKLEMAKKMKTMGIESKVISEVTSLSVEEISKL